MSDDSRLRPSGPLSGLRVIAFEHAWAAPYGTMMLADLGADVVKVEPPGVGDHVRNWTRNDLGGLSPHFLSVNRNKRSIVLDLKSDEGRRVALDLVRRADAVVSNFKPGTLESLGLGYGDSSRDNPSLVYCQVSGFGSSGPYAGRRAYDLMLQAEGGLISVTGTDEENLVKVGAPIVDIMAAMVSAFSIVAAIRDREREGRGRLIDISMLDVATSVMAFNLFSYGISGELPRPMGTAHPLLAPYEVYITRTGPVAIAVLTEAHWARFCQLIDREDLRDRPEFASAPMRVENRLQLNEEIDPVLRRWDQADLVGAMVDAGLACAQVNDVAGLLAHPQLNYRGFFSTWNIGDHMVRAPGAPWRATAHGDQPDRDCLPASTPGVDAESILGDWLGLSAAETKSIREAGGLG